MGLDVDVGVVGDVELDLGDGAAGEAAVDADAHAFTVQREVAGLGADLGGGDGLVVDVQRGGAVRLAVFADGRRGEVDAEDALGAAHGPFVDRDVVVRADPEGVPPALTEDLGQERVLHRDVRVVAREPGGDLGDVGARQGVRRRRRGSARAT